MKKISIFATLAAAFALAAVPVAAQDSETVNFLDNYLYGYRFNPSTRPYRTSGFFMVGAGNVAVTADMNVGAGNFLFKTTDGQLVNGFNSAVSYDDFITPLPQKIGLGADINENIIAIASTGKKGGFRNFEVNLVTKDHFSIDKNLLAALKSNDGTTSTFTANDITAASQNYLEIAFGGSKRLASFLSIGIRAKGLVGLADVNFKIDEMSLTPDTGSGNLLVNGKGSFTAAAAPLNIPVSGGYYDFLSVGRGALRPAGIGAALDAGATIHIWQDRIQLGAAVHDLGFMQWTTDKSGKMNYTAKPVSTSGGATGVISDLLQFAPEAGYEPETLRNKLPMYYTASVKVKPVSILSLGALANIVSDAEGNLVPIMRYGVAFTPFRQLNVAGSYTNVEGVQSVGFAASLRLLGISVTAGIDSFLTNEGDGFQSMTFMPTYYVPIQPVNTTVNLGVALAFGMSKERWSEVTKVKAKTKKAKTKEKEEVLEEIEEEAPMTKAEAKKAAKEQAKADAAAAKEQAKAEEAAAKAQAEAEAAAAKAAAKEQAKADKKAAKEAEKAAKKAAKNGAETAAEVVEGAAAGAAVSATEGAAATTIGITAEQAAAQKALEEAQAARAAAEQAKAQAEAELKAIQEKAEADKAAAEAKAAADAAAQAKSEAEAAAALQAAKEQAEAQAQEALKAAQEAQAAQAEAQAKAAAEAEAAAQAAADKAAAEAAEIARKVAEEAAAEQAAAEAAAKAAAEAAQAVPMTEEEARAAAIAQAEAEAKAAEEEAARAAAEAEAALNGTTTTPAQ